VIFTPGFFLTNAAMIVSRVARSSPRQWKNSISPLSFVALVAGVLNANTREADSTKTLIRIKRERSLDELLFIRLPHFLNDDRSPFN
jgi:hypothetical protein